MRADAFSKRHPAVNFVFFLGAILFQELLRFFMLFFHNRNYLFIDLFLRFC